MKTRVIKKNNKELLRRHGRGFFGRALCIQFDDKFIAVQNIRRRPRTEAVIRYCDFEPTEDELYKLRQVFLHKYKCELASLISLSYFCGSVEEGAKFVRQFDPINRQCEMKLYSSKASAPSVG